jgi:peptide/nickel transport system ATP-binding protein
MVMYAGQVAEFGETRRVFDKPLHPYSNGLLEAFPSIRGTKTHLLGIPGTPPDLLRPPAGCRFAPRCPHAMAVCHAAEPHLLDIDGDLVRCVLYDDRVVTANGQRRPTAAAAAAPEGTS